MEFSKEKLSLAKKALARGLESRGLTAYRFLEPREEEASDEIRSIAVVLLPYFAGNLEGNLAMYCRGKDYHQVAPALLEEAAAEARDILGEGAVVRAYADTGPLHDRFLVLRSGLGIKGLNQMVISPVFGSYFFVTYITLNAPLEPDPAVVWTPEVSCLKCGRCLAACPGGALRPDGSFVYENCLSGITQKTGELTEGEKAILRKKTMIFGCDECQKACPLNAQIPLTPIPAFREAMICRLEREDLEGLTRRTMKEKYPDRAFTWRGPQVMLRNLAILADTEDRA